MPFSDVRWLCHKEAQKALKALLFTIRKRAENGSFDLPDRPASALLQIAWVCRQCPLLTLRRKVQESPNVMADYSARDFDVNLRRT